MTTKLAMHILELKPPVAQADIKKAFRKLSKRHHPDTYLGRTEEFIRIKEAYDFLVKRSTSELQFGSMPPPHRNPVRGQVYISDFPLLIFIEKCINRYRHLKRIPLLGFLIRKSSSIIRYIATNPRGSVTHKWLQLFTMMLFSITLLPLALLVLIISWPLWVLVKWWQQKFA